MCACVCVCGGGGGKCRLSWDQGAGVVRLMSNISALHVECILILCTEKANGGIK